MDREAGFGRGVTPIDIPRVDVLGVRVSAINMSDALSALDRWIEGRERTYVCVTGVHGVMESQRDPDLAEIAGRWRPC